MHAATNLSLARVSAETPRYPDASDTHALGEAIASLAAGLHAATYQLLVMLHEFDARAGWNTGFLSCAHWLHWRTGFDLGASREKVRVARALPTLPRISWAMQHGQLSYAKVRALTRVATPDNETALLGVALNGTAAQAERLVRAWRRVDRASEAQDDERRHLNRELSTWVDDDGMVVIRGRLTPDAGALVLRALETAADRLYQDACHAATGNTLAEDVTAGQRRADALALLAQASLSADLNADCTGDRHGVVLHVDAGNPGAGGVIELDHTAQRVSAETSRRLACDASVVTVTSDDQSEPSQTRRSRAIPVSIRRALAARDHTSRFPGCTSRRCDAHHIEHWVDGGATRLDNLVRLCRRHHRAVHEGGFDLRVQADGALAFYSPAGSLLPIVPMHARTFPIEAVTPPPASDGTRLDVAWAIDVLWQPRRE